jgi:hypothetical protein
MEPKYLLLCSQNPDTCSSHEPHESGSHLQTLFTEYPCNIIHPSTYRFLLYECETWSLTLREEHRLNGFKDRVLRRIFGLRKQEVQADGGNCIIRMTVTCTPHQVILG